MFETTIKCEVYEPMAGKVMHGSNVGIPQPACAESRMAFGSEYTICSPMSPYALGWSNWQILKDEANGRDFSEVFQPVVDFEKNIITIYRIADRRIH